MPTEAPDTEVFDVPEFLRNTKNLIAQIADLRSKNASDREIAIAVGIPEDSLLIKSCPT